MRISGQGWTKKTTKKRLRVLIPRSLAAKGGDAPGFIIDEDDGSMLCTVSEGRAQKATRPR